MIRKIFHSLLPSLLLSGALNVAAAGQNNAALLPAYKPDSQVKMERSADGKTETPDWIKSLILVEVRIDTASTDGTIKGLDKVLDHLAQLGVNGVWLTPPINEGNGYGNFGAHSVSARLTGETDPARQWQALKDFVDKAHRRNLRVFFDVVTWGVTKHEGGSELKQLKPEWFEEYFAPYAGWLFNWKDKELNEWFASRLVEWFLLTGVDGFRCDCAPQYAGFAPYKTAKERMRKFGRKVIFIAEWTTSGKNVFDLDQLTFCYRTEKGRRETHWVGDFYLKNNIVDMIRNGQELWAYDDMALAPGKKRFYTMMLDCHDSRRYAVKGSRIAIGYQAILAP
ncbi:MAG: alpha-amylase family glycosyl hydrolase, partial [Victivallaceae bacterium]|nr:alpha-amylase family glycosyl hydrolase [Victivallaceae bacterium]